MPFTSESCKGHGHESHTHSAFDELPHAQAVALADYRCRRECEALTRLEALKPAALRDRCHARVSHGRPYVEVLRLAAEEQADLIVLGVHGRNPVDMALFGSTTQPDRAPRDLSRTDRAALVAGRRGRAHWEPCVSISETQSRRRARDLCRSSGEPPKAQDT
jgi:hypothetical protein